jgi:uncharacterized membrane protein YqjE
MADSAQGTAAQSKGLLASLGGLASTLVAIAHTRLEMLALDLEEGRDYILAQLLLGLVGLFCIGVGVVVAAILVAVVFWDTHRLLALGLVSGFFLAAGLLAFALITHKAKTKPRLFAGSLTELLKDRQQLAAE